MYFVLDCVVFEGVLSIVRGLCSGKYVASNFVMRVIVREDIEFDIQYEESISCVFLVGRDRFLYLNTVHFPRDGVFISRECLCSVMQSLWSGIDISRCNMVFEEESIQFVSKESRYDVRFPLGKFVGSVADLPDQTIFTNRCWVCIESFYGIMCMMKEKDVEISISNGSITFYCMENKIRSCLNFTSETNIESDRITMNIELLLVNFVKRIYQENRDQLEMEVQISSKTCFALQSVDHKKKIYVAHMANCC